MFGMVVETDPGTPFPPKLDPCAYAALDDPASAYREAIAAQEPAMWKATCAATRVTTLDGLDRWLEGQCNGVN